MFSDVGADLLLLLPDYSLLQLSKDYDMFEARGERNSSSRVLSLSSWNVPVVVLLKDTTFILPCVVTILSNRREAYALITLMYCNRLHAR